MSSYRKFDPDAVLRGIENQGAEAAKVAKPAKVSGPGRSTLAALAGLAGGKPESETRSAEASPFFDASGLRDRYEERAAIGQFDGHQDRARAEARAWHEVAAIWHRQHGERSPGAICAGCGLPLSGPEVLPLPHGDRVHADSRDRAFQCLHLYERRWKAAAAAALSAMGIPAPAGDGEMAT